MSKISCNIIYDLLPSYLDNICSEDSRQLVEEHFKECQSCQNLYESMKKSQFVPDKLEERQVTYLKKVKRRDQIKNILLFGIVFILLFILCYYNFYSYRFAEMNIARTINYLFTPIVSVYLFIMLSHYPAAKKKSGKLTAGVACCELAAMLYMTGVMIYTIVACGKGKIVFGITDMALLGPFLARQIKFFEVCYLLVFMSTIIVTYRTKKMNILWLTLPLVGFSLMANYLLILKRADASIETVIISILSSQIILVGEVLLIMLFSRFIRRKIGTSEEL